MLHINYMFGLEVVNSLKSLNVPVKVEYKSTSLMQKICWLMQQTKENIFNNICSRLQLSVKYQVYFFLFAANLQWTFVKVLNKQMENKQREKINWRCEKQNKLYWSRKGMTANLSGNASRSLLRFENENIWFFGKKIPSSRSWTSDLWITAEA